MKKFEQVSLEIGDRVIELNIIKNKYPDGAITYHSHDKGLVCEIDIDKL